MHVTCEGEEKNLLQSSSAKELIQLEKEAKVELLRMINCMKFFMLSEALLS